VPIYGDGANVLPLLHVQELASYVVSLVSAQPKQQYFLVAEAQAVKQSEVAAAVARGLGSGATRSGRHPPRGCTMLRKDVVKPVEVSISMAHRAGMCCGTHCCVMHSKAQQVTTILVAWELHCTTSSLVPHASTPWHHAVPRELATACRTTRVGGDNDPGLQC
jgi:hypothetical protein